MSTGQDIVDEVRGALNDEDASNYRWSNAELLRFVNAGQRQIVLIVPEAKVLETEESVVVGAKQAIPDGGIQFLGVWNYDADADARGPAMTQVEFDALNSSFAEWSQGTYKDAYFDYPSSADEHSADFFENFAHDPRDPKHFYLSPAPTSVAGQVLVKYSVVPTALASLATDLELDDEYFNALVDYVTYRALLKEGRFASSPEEREELWNHFLRSLGFYVEATKRVDPATTRPPADAHG